MLSLPKIQKGHNSRLLVLWRISLEDLINELKALLIKFERNRGVVFGGVAMLESNWSVMREKLERDNGIDLRR